MCGICGILNRDSERLVDRGMLEAMATSIRHRGPDESGYHVDGPVGLAMRRLSIIDVAGGSQPIHNEDRTVHIVYNGEIYNYRTLRDELLTRGHTFSTLSDTEVIAHAYEEDPRGFVARLRGMFAFAIWDSRIRRLTLAGDRFAIKPLYYAVTDDGIVFGSELKTIMVTDRAPRDLDFEALGHYFTLGYIPAPSTAFRAVKKLRPGCLLTWTAESGAEVRTYWAPGRVTIDRQRSADETRAILRQLLRDAVESHLVSDVPLGAFLSGGIDSSTVVALMSEVSDEPVKTFSIGFDDPRHNELDKARIVARRFRTDHHELVVEPANVDLLPELIAHFDEPFADSSALPTYYVSKLAREHVKVALSGDGGDEVFLGYTYFRGLELARHLQVLPGPVRAALGSALRLVPHTGSAALNDRLRLTAKRASDSVLAPEEAYRRKISMIGLPTVRPLLSSEFGSELDRTDPFRLVDEALACGAARRGAHPLQQFSETALRISLAGDMLVKVDRMSMANSLEVRVPLLDHELVEFVETIPIEQRFPRWRLKGLLKESVADLLPREILHQKKQGFTVPLARWFRGDLAGFATEVLTDPETQRQGFLDPAAISPFLRRHREGRTDVGPVIWSLLVFALWSRVLLR